MNLCVHPNLLSSQTCCDLLNNSLGLSSLRLLFFITVFYYIMLLMLLNAVLFIVGILVPVIGLVVLVNEVR